MVGIDDVAAAAGVSTATVSRALRGLPRVSPATRSRILATAKELGYVPSSAASRLASGKTRTVGVLAPYVDRWFFGKAIAGVDHELHARGYNLSLFNLGGRSAPRERLFSRAMVHKQIDALLLLCMYLHPEEIEDLHAIEMPLVVVGGPVVGIATVGIDDYRAARAITEHLIHLGHRHIALLHGSDDLELNFSVPKIRVEGFHDAVHAAGLELDPDAGLFGNFTVASGVEAMRRFMRLPEPRPTAMVCASDEMALGVLFEARRQGLRVPEDFSVVGIDGHEMGAAAGLTTVWQDPMAQARRGTQMLLAELSGEDGAVRSEVAEQRLIVRETTAPPPTF
ncbi:DNA-binding transcriptional regulator CytR [Sinomonas cyclohexanicum]|uniref:DNA-binding transcriptional regulator CytR n=1 Tax=Sinomonas cyclohexanicum TaxID=322009 RepID=A0ABN6FEW9_SINCY|nr:LacI family DNA-binding transcriptional regulator [Corynebacterium cyclohexanicum]BCT74581.1 DNA-binding transcriptional regulator CytR [Corynebacterium cyclohexanicum]